MNKEWTLCFTAVSSALLMAMIDLFFTSWGQSTTPQIVMIPSVWKSSIGAHELRWFGDVLGASFIGYVGAWIFHGAKKHQIRKSILLITLATLFASIHFFTGVLTVVLLLCVITSFHYLIARYGSELLNQSPVSDLVNWKGTVTIMTGASLSMGLKYGLVPGILLGWAYPILTGNLLLTIVRQWVSDFKRTSRVKTR